MEILKRTISLDDLMTKQEGLSYGIFTATSIYMKVNLVQTIDDMGIVTNLPFERFGSPCKTLKGGFITKHITCYDGSGDPPNTGQLTVEPSGGLEPYTYQWSNGGTDATISNLGPGIYDVTVTDAEGCQITLRGVVNVKESADPELIGNFTSDQYYRIPSSEGGYEVISLDGYIVSGENINLNTLTQPYNTNRIILCTSQKITLSTAIPYNSYQWSNGDTSPSILIQDPGTYTVNVVDSDGCEGTASITIEQITIPQPTIEPNKQPVSGDGTMEDPYVFCSNQHPVTLTLTNSSYFDSWTWNNGSPNQISIQPNLTEAATAYGFDTGDISSICCQIGCPPIQTPMVWIRFSSLPVDDCGIDTSGTGVSG